MYVETYDWERAALGLASAGSLADGLGGDAVLGDVLGWRAARMG